MSEDNFQDWVDQLTEVEQPKCSIENQDECEACGS